MLWAGEPTGEIDPKPHVWLRDKPGLSKPEGPNGPSDFVVNYPTSLAI